MRLRGLTFMGLLLALGFSTGNQAPTVPGPMLASRSYRETACAVVFVHICNYMQFRTAAGGFESGSAIIDAQGNVSISSYWPYGASMQGSPFNNYTMLATNFSEDTSGTFLRLADSGGGSDYVFGTGQGF